jgi:hypothetical protein
MEAIDRPFDPDRIEVRTVHVDGSCPDTHTCDRVTDIDHPDCLFIVATPEADPAILAAHAELLGPGEQLMRWKRRTGMPAVPPA